MAKSTSPAAITASIDALETSLAGVTGLTLVNLVSAAPASSTATGELGDFFVDATYLYAAIATDTWVRIAVTDTSF